MALSRSIHVAANGSISFFLMAEQYSIVYKYHIFFIHSSVYGHLDCFHVLAIVYSATVNVEVPGCFQVSLLLCLGVGLLDNMVALFLVF